MTAHILFAAAPDRWAQYEHPLRDALAAHRIDHVLATQMSPEKVDYIVYAPNSEVQDFTPYTRLKAVLNLWAGVEAVVGNDTLKVPLTRMVDEEGLTQGMVEWVCGHVLRHHLGMDAHIINPNHEWQPIAPPLANDRPVTILGMGELGRACARALRSLGFAVTGWGRTDRAFAGIRYFHGQDGFEQALNGAQIVVLLLPDTAETENILDAYSIPMLAPGAVVINPGRGPLIDDDALCEALESGRLNHATLDVFRTEPLPKDHRFWSHPKITVTPHIASETRPETAARVIAENIRRGEAGVKLAHLVDRDAGY